MARKPDEAFIERVTTVGDSISTATSSSCRNPPHGYSSQWLSLSRSGHVATKISEWPQLSHFSR